MQSPKVSPPRGPGRSPPRSNSGRHLDGTPNSFAPPKTPTEGMRTLTAALSGPALHGMSLPGSPYPTGAVPATASSAPPGRGASEFAHLAPLTSDLVPTPPSTPGKGGLVSTLAMANASLGQASAPSSYSPIPLSPDPKSTTAMAAQHAATVAQHAAKVASSHGSPPPPWAMAMATADLSSRRLLGKATPRTPGTPARPL